MYSNMIKIEHHLTFKDIFGGLITLRVLDNGLILLYIEVYEVGYISNRPFDYLALLVPLWGQENYLNLSLKP